MKKEPKSKRYIEETFMMLLEKKKPEKITVLEICRESDINKSTFYVYYHDIYELLDHLQEEVLRKILNSVNEGSRHGITNADELSKNVLRACTEQTDTIKLLFSDTQLYKLPMKLDSLIREIYFTDHPEKTTTEKSLKISFEVYGAYGAFINNPQYDEKLRLEVISRLIDFLN